MEGLGGWVANKINELALVEGNLPSSLVMVVLYSAMEARRWRTFYFHPTNLVDEFMQNCFYCVIYIMVFSIILS